MTYLERWMPVFVVMFLLNIVGFALLWFEHREIRAKREKEQRAAGPAAPRDHPSGA